MFESFNDHARSLKEALQAQITEDWHNDIAGRTGTGRMTRTVIRDEDFYDNMEGDDSAEFVMFLMELEQNYTVAIVRANNIQSGTQNFVDRVGAVLREARREMDELLLRAAILPDGRKAFMGADGIAITEDGEIVPAEIAAGIDWTGKPTREEFEAHQARIRNLEDLAIRGDDLNNRAGQIQDSLNNPDAKRSQDALDALNRGMDDIERELNQLNSELKSVSKLELKHEDGYDAAVGESSDLDMDAMFKL